MDYNTHDIQMHLEMLTKRWHELDKDALFEIRCLKENHPTQIKRFPKTEISAAIEYATQWNVQKYNIYTTVNPINHNANGHAANDKDIIGSFYAYCDCDDEDSMKNVNKSFKEDFRGSFGVYTGQKPKRGHIYYELAEPTTDLDGWRNLQKGIAKKMHSDPVVHNPSRIMRLAGTVNYPDAKKRQKGRVTELTQYIKLDKVTRPIKELEHVFPFEEYKPNFQVNLGLSSYESFDIDRAIANMRANNSWHDNMIRAVMSMAAKGYTDQEIHARMSNVTTSGYSQEQTDKEINIAIQGARSKAVELKPRSNSSIDDNNNNLKLADAIRPWELRDPSTIPPREFLYGNMYISKYASLTVAPGGVGKSSLCMCEGIAMATGRAILNVQPIHTKVLYINGEDPYDDMLLRAKAICTYFDIDERELIDRFYMVSGRDWKLNLIIGESSMVNEEHVEQLKSEIKKYNIKCCILDPLANMHTSTESVDSFRVLGDLVSSIADECNCSVHLVHHTRKIQAGQSEVDENSARGGSSLVSAMRAARVLNKMSKTEAENLGLNTHIDHFKIEPAGKNNLSRPLEKTVWYKKIGVHVGMHEIAVCEEWTAPSVFDDLSTDKLRNLQNSIRETEYTLLSNNRTTKNDYKMSCHEFICDFLDWETDAQVNKRKTKTLMNTWLENDLLQEKTIEGYKIDPKTYRKGREIKIIKVGGERL